MNKKLLAPAVCLMIFLSAAAQPQPVGHLTIFSEDGDKFTLILNGEKQNNTPQTNLRVEDLTQDYYNAKVIFADASLGEISKNYLAIADANGVKQDVTYKIKKNKNNGKMTLNYFSMAPVVQGYVAPSNVYVVRTGQPQTVVTTTPANTTVTQTTTTVTGGNTVGANVNVGGVNVGVSINDPLLNGSVTQTTTTTHTTTSSNTSTTNTAPAAVGCRNAYPMSSTDFSSALTSVKNQGFDETRLKSAKQIAGSNCLNASQIKQLCQVFSFEETKLDFAKFAYDHCTEPNNYFKINDVFGFSSSVDELNDYISGR